jgi:energy-coupling factor transporter ATP-binding protein EcfA2
MNVAETGSATTLDTENPFPGLRPFEAEDSEFFFGREDDMQDLLSRLRRTRFLAVVGSSGCGKSSVVRAGLVASLQDGFMAEACVPWRIAIMRPGNNPIAQLACELNKPGALGDADEQGEEHVAMLQAALRRGSLGIVEVVRDAAFPPGTKTLILVDQFEELFRFAQGSQLEKVKDGAGEGTAAAAAVASNNGKPQLDSSDEARAFVKLLLAAASSSDETTPIYVVLTMRSEFLGNCAAFPGLPDAINDGLYLLPQMNREQLRDAIKEPIDTSGGQISNRLLNRLLNDLGEDADQLPILQHALMRLWALWLPRREQGPMDFDQYEKIGQLQGSLSTHAEETFNELSIEQQAIAEKLFRLITDTTPDNQKVRRPLKLKKICELAKINPADLIPVIEKFREKYRSFLMPPYDVPLDDETMIDISHESLIRQWGRLREWADLEVKETRVYRRLVENVKSWEDERRNSDSLYRGLRLAETEDWVKSHPDRLNQVEQDFMKASRKAANVQRNLALMVFAVIAVALLSLSLYAAYKGRSAAQERDRALSAEQDVLRQIEVAEQERKRADATNEEFTKLFRAFYSDYGGIDEGINEEDLKKIAKESLAAQEALQQLPFSDDETTRREGIEIRFFLKNKPEETKVDPYLVRDALAELGFDKITTDLPSREGRVPFNSIWADVAKVDINDVKAVAYTLIRVGFQIKDIGCYPSGKMPRRNLPAIMGGGESGVVKADTMTVEQIKNATSFRACQQ